MLRAHLVLPCCQPCQPVTMDALQLRPLCLQLRVVPASPFEHSTAQHTLGSSMRFARQPCVGA
jgi:hypothetical protein